MFPALSVISLQSKLDSSLSSHSSFIHLQYRFPEHNFLLEANFQTNGSSRFLQL